MAKGKTTPPADPRPASSTGSESDPAAAPPAEGFTTERVALADLRPHPRNYRGHPEDQIEHIAASLRAHGLYRPVVIARDNVILAGHGLVLGAKRVGWTEITCRRCDVESDSPLALKILTGDNEISNLVEGDDRALTDLLNEIKSSDPEGLLGTGYDEKMLASLIFVTRPASEVKTIDEAAEWVGLPEFGDAPEEVKVAVVFRSKEDRLKWVAQMERAGFAMKMHYKSESVWSTWWPVKERDDLVNVRFEEQPPAAVEA